MSLDSHPPNDATTAQQIICLFNCLSTNSARRAAYHGILDQLNSPEWCDVRARMAQRTFQKDILGESLPEVALQIVQYLRVTDLHVLQRWTNKFSTKLTAADFRRYAQRKLRLERGQPAHEPLSFDPVTPGTARDDGPNYYRPPTPDTLAYADGRCAWLRSSDVIVVHDIRKATRQQFCTENRDRFRLLGLSECVIAAVSIRAFCHVWDLETQEHAWFRLPSSSLTGFAVRSSIVAVAYNSTKTIKPENRVNIESIMYWDMRSRTAHAIENVPNVVLLDLQPATKTLIIVHVEREETYQVCVRKYIMDGQGHAHIQRSYALPAVHRDWTLETVSRTWDSNHHRFAVFFIQSPLAKAPRRLFQWVIATYDPQTDGIGLHEFTWNDRPKYFLRAAAVDHNLLYYLREDHGTQAIWISDPSAHPPHRAAKAMDPSCRGKEGILLGDQEYVLLLHQMEAKVWPFRDDTLVNN
ncbi:F-box domain protein [Aspergillus homomorphus CBS 101889]|uniref:F-box domain-containing protein n=1 Tax=Aspergillus homomorphus (strain CBS 101889) TaxID=1450537 RepID=A0A395I0P2_ASPHC|nr:hypothetical protein BO97DRAFT_449711 [Aspergillus homomorphus CBS 101889]RAL13640.1 hypothetical protein BO97DRAFT_449711 [Aspergillus homomorphus CBS 101889]